MAGAAKWFVDTLEKMDSKAETVMSELQKDHGDVLDHSNGHGDALPDNAVDAQVSHRWEVDGCCWLWYGAKRMVHHQAHRKPESKSMQHKQAECLGKKCGAGISTAEKTKHSKLQNPHTTPQHTTPDDPHPGTPLPGWGQTWPSYGRASETSCTHQLRGGGPEL